MLALEHCKNDSAIQLVWNEIDESFKDKPKLGRDFQLQICANHDLFDAFRREALLCMRIWVRYRIFTDRVRRVIRLLN